MIWSLQTLQLGDDRIFSFLHIHRTDRLQEFLNRLIRLSTIKLRNTSSISDHAHRRMMEIHPIATNVQGHSDVSPLQQCHESSRFVCRMLSCDLVPGQTKGLFGESTAQFVVIERGR